MCISFVDCGLSSSKFSWCWTGLQVYKYPPFSLGCGLASAFPSREEQSENISQTTTSVNYHRPNPTNYCIEGYSSDIMSRLRSTILLFLAFLLMALPIASANLSTLQADSKFLITPSMTTPPASISQLLLSPSFPPHHNLTNQALA